MVKEYKIGDFLKRVKNAIEIQDGVLYKRVTIKTNHQGVTLRDQADGSVIGTKSQFTVSGGDFILSKIDARYGAFGIIPEELDGAIITGNFWTYKVDTEIVDTEWFFYFTHSYNFIQICQESSTGTTHRKYLDEKTFLDHKLTIPDKVEQVRMVKQYLTSSKVSKKCADEITNQKQLLSKFKQAILQEAIQGKLTEDWRRLNPNVEPASELLKHIKAEKEKLVKEKKIKKEKPLPPIADDEIPFELPKGWVWCRMQESGLYERGKSKHRPRNDVKLFEDGDIPFVQTGEVAQSKHSQYLINSCSTYYNAFGLAQSRLWPKGTMCITIAANIAQTGFLNIDACFPDSVVGFTALSDSSISKYIRYFIDLTKTDIEKYAPATAQKNINLGIIYELKLPLPPEEEIIAIVQKVEALMEKCRILEAEITQSEAHAQMLMHAVLKEAFEPAEVIELEKQIIFN